MPERLEHAHDIAREVVGRVAVRRLVAAAVTALVEGEIVARGLGERLGDRLPHRVVRRRAVQEDDGRPPVPAAGTPCRRRPGCGTGRRCRRGRWHQTFGSTSVFRAAMRPRTISLRLASTSPSPYSYMPPPDLKPSLPSAILSLMNCGVSELTSSSLLR